MELVMASLVSDGGLVITRKVGVGANAYAAMGVSDSNGKSFMLVSKVAWFQYRLVALCLVEGDVRVVLHFMRKICRTEFPRVPPEKNNFFTEAVGCSSWHFYLLK